MKRKKNLKKKRVNLQNYYMVFKEQQTWNKAKNYIEMIKRELINFPEFLQEYIMKNFMPNYKKIHKIY